MNLETLRSIQARIRNSTGPDRELDGDIIVAFKGGEIVWKTAMMEQYPAHRYPDKNYYSGFANEHVPFLTGSLDACVALQEAELPGSFREVDAGTIGDGPVVRVYWRGFHAGVHALETHAHLLAIFAAVIAREEAKEKAT